MSPFAAVAARMAQFRHRLHETPETAGCEFATMSLIRNELDRIGIAPLPPFIGTDTVALLHGCKAGKNVTLRADIDALPITEETGVHYASKIPGVMHACGHDGHSAMVMGAAEILYGLRDSFSGSVRFVWQPGEENAALGKKLIEAGALENPPADLVTAIHGMPGLPVGVFGCRDGAIMGSCAHFKVTVQGKGGHSSRPHLTHDPVVTAAAIIMEAQTLVSRRIDPLQPAVFSICRISGGTSANIIPESVELTGTARALDMNAAAELKHGFCEIVENICRMYRCSARIDYDIQYPVTENAPAPTELARQVIKNAFGESRYVELPESSMGAEDFAYYLRRYPGVYVKLGVGENSPVIHNSKFDFPDAALEAGIRYLVDFALAGLR